MNQTVNQAMSQLGYRTGSSPLVGSLYGSPSSAVTGYRSQSDNPFEQKMEPPVAADEKNMSTPFRHPHHHLTIVTSETLMSFTSGLHTTIVHYPLKNPDFKK